MFFFFKQKTAYDLRISDWSSDVCSSDLPADTTVGAVAQIDDVILAPAQIPQKGRPHWETIVVDLNIVLFAVHIIGHADLAGQPDEIGRASCRARVCQYV